METIVIAVLFLGLFFLAVGAAGMYRLPDVYTRSHALGVTDTLGVGLVLTGLTLYQGLSMNAVKITLILILLYHLNPVISHATVRAALRAGVKPWSRETAERGEERGAPAPAGREGNR
jgi:multicomponent Na+:H+ antiporter subunit G